MVKTFPEWFPKTKEENYITNAASTFVERCVFYKFTCSDCTNVVAWNEVTRPLQFNCRESDLVSWFSCVLENEHNAS